MADTARPQNAANGSQHLLTTLGLCARARKLVVGTPMVCEAMRDGGILCVLEASDTSDNTHARLTSKCTYYGVPHHRLTADAASLARAVGKTGAVAAVGVTDPALYRALARSLGPGVPETPAGAD